MSIYDYTVTTIHGEEKSLKNYEGQVLLIVNTASKCGFTPQFEELQQLYEKYRNEGFVVLGFPCNQFGNQDPGTNEEIESFCKMNYGVTFPMFAKIDVNGENAHPLYKYLTKETSGILSDKIKWNFTKFLINREGKVVDRFAPQVKPHTLESNIEKELRQ
ncbi:glutathione peroxidase [Aliibacillus thermotolerans]|uniref:Glutathione peroxidase n=1 Tax=Aliibacillus thermotolerans TaxID=1834418 RepID=A0ABW0U4V7_9BACI|nr:glutathione peroxidase [Aliibacillus thermotolerans]MDA3130524.1 redoxin domain-containing protein [Aliibacillus thermotolerans]